MGAMLLTNSTTAATVAASGTIPIGSAVHGYGQYIKLNGNAINISGSGYYDIESSFSISVTGTGTASVTMYSNGSPVAGATASATADTAADVINLSIPWVVRKSCCCEPTSITFVLSAAGTVNNATVKISKI